MDSSNNKVSYTWEGGDDLNMDKKSDKTVEEQLTDTLDGKSDEKEDANLDEKKDSGEPESPPTYTLPGQNDADGKPKQFTGEQVVAEASRLNSENARMAQELSDSKKLTEDKHSTEEVKEVGLTPSEQAVLAELKSKFKVMTEEDFEKRMSDREQEIVKKAARVSTTQSELKQALSELEEDYDGSEEEVNGVKIAKPKVEQAKVLDFIIKNPNTELSPFEIAQAVYSADFVQYEAKKIAASGASKGLPQTEEEGAGGGEPPKGKPVSFKDGSAEQAVREIITAS